MMLWTDVVYMTTLCVLYAFANIWYCATYVLVWLRTRRFCVGVFKYALWKISEHFFTVLFFSAIMYSSSTYDIPPKLHSIHTHNLPHTHTHHPSYCLNMCRVSSVLSHKASYTFAIISYKTYMRSISPILNSLIRFHIYISKKHFKVYMSI